MPFEKDATRIELGRDNPALKAFEEMENGALIDAVDLFQENPLNLGVRLLSEINLPSPWAELAAAEIWLDSGGGLADLGMRDHDGRGNVIGMFQVLREDAGTILRLGRGWEIGEFVVFVAGGVALERAGLKPF